MQGSGAFSLAMVQGPQPGQIFELPHGTISIGRDPGNQIMIDDAQISRQHARIMPQGGLMVLEDLGSTNGTTINGLRISSPHTLAHGDEIGLGDHVTLTFYGQPVSNVGETIVAPRAAYAVPPQPTPSYPPPAYDAASGYRPPVDYGAAQPVEMEYSDEPEYYDEEYYEDDAGYNVALIGGCLLVAVIALLLLAVFIYFFAPASIVDPIYDFLVGLGITVP